MHSLGSTPSKTYIENPLPWKQLSVLLILHLAEPISATIIYPFIAQLISELGVSTGEKSNVGYYVGLVESLFFMTEAVFILQWGRLSDRIGRKPVLMIGLFGLTLSMLSFGLSHRLITIIASRALAGALNGNVGVLKSAIGEIADETNMARAFSFIPLVWFIGSTIAPLMGGFLSHPSDRFPDLFSSSSFWAKNPYFLPCGTAATFSLISCILTGLILQETHPLMQKSRRRNYFRSRADSEATLFDADEAATRLLSPSTAKGKAPSPEDSDIPLRSLLTPQVKIAVLNYGLLAFLEISFQALLPTFLATALHMSPVSIGIVLGTMGLVNGVVQILFFVPLHRRVGTRNMFTIGICAFIIIFITFPFIKKEWDCNGGRLGWWGILLLAIQILLCPIENMSFNVIFLYVQAASPSQATLGATNGIAQTAASIARAIGPASATSLFALSAQHPDLLGGGLVYFILCMMTFIAIGVSRMLPDEPRAGHQRKLSQDIEDE